jgi:hypothetical protein
LSFDSNRIDDLIEMLAVCEFNRSAPLRESRKMASLVFSKALLKLSTSRARAIGAVCAAKDIKPSAHENASSFETAGSTGLLRTRLA